MKIPTVQRTALFTDRGRYDNDYVSLERRHLDRAQNRLNYRLDLCFSAPSLFVTRTCAQTEIYTTLNAEREILRVVSRGRNGCARTRPISRYP